MDLLLVGKCLGYLEDFIGGWLVKRVDPTVIQAAGSRLCPSGANFLVLLRAL